MSTYQEAVTTMRKTILLKRGNTLMVAQGAGSTIEVRGADVWVTEDGDARDHVMRFGKMRIRSDACALIYAFSDATVTLDAPPGAVVQVRRRGELPERLASPATVLNAFGYVRRWFAFE